ncbi:MAG: hypothetical protein ACK5KT_02350 [Dysgonomonas sp.]
MILYFNPGHETAVNNTSPYYTSPANTVAMQQELAFLPAWYGTEGDIVLVEDSTNKEHYSYLSDNLGQIPKAVMQDALTTISGSDISLWGISPQSVHYFKGLSNELDIKLNIPEWKEDFIYLNSRKAAKDSLLELIDRIPQISDDIVPRFYNKLEDIEQAVNSSRAQLLSKAPYSSSGRGLLWLPVTGLTRTERQILHGTLKKQGDVSIERVLEKVTDLAMEFMSDGQGNITFEGYSLFQTNNKGGYLGNYIGAQDNIVCQLTNNLSSSLLDSVKTNLTEVLKSKYASLYKGCIGVDMLIYRENGEYKLHPCLEINMRYNMGYLALKLYEKHISALSYGEFRLDFRKNEGDIYKEHLQMQQTYPTLFESQKLKKGYLSLCPVNEKSRYWAYILIND